MQSNVHERVWEQIEVKPWRPMVTYTLLGIMAGVYLMQSILPDPRIWVVAPDWMARPWSPITSTFAHGSVMHLLFNGLMLYFFGPVLERIIGGKDLAILFLITGAASGILQVEIAEAVYGFARGALGASGALMCVFGTLMVLMPNQRIMVYGIIPVRFWIAGIAYGLLDVMGAFDAGNGIGNFAHLTGMAMGLAYGVGLRQAAAALRQASPFGGR